MAAAQSDDIDREKIASEYLQSEENSDREISKCDSLKDDTQDKHISEKSRLLTPIFRINSKESLARNEKFLRDLELAKARLRTYAAYSPTDQELQQRIEEYRAHLERNMRKSNFSRRQTIS